MALIVTHNKTEFGVGDTVRVTQKITEGDKSRSQVFEGIVMGIKGREENKTFIVRRIGAQQIGIERIFPLTSPTIEKIEVVRNGTKGVRHAKLFYTRDKSRKEIEKIYSRAARKSKKQ
jgi:large subunit ribosomal protein L19